MSRSIFDPTHGDMEQEGWTFSPPAADQISESEMQAEDHAAQAAKGDPDVAPPSDPELADIARIEDL